MSNSSLVSYIKLSPNYNSRTSSIKKITVHHMAGNLSIERCGELFSAGGREASSNYGIGTDGRVGMYVEEKNRAWTSSNRDNDMQAVTIEVANNSGAPNWPVSDKAWNKLVELCVDICKRNGIKELKWTGDSKGTLTCHYMFVATACPGPYLKGRMAELAKTVTEKLKQPTPSKTLYRVQFGAYKVYDNALKQQAAVKKAGFDAIIVKVDGLYKVQVGAFSMKANAEKQLTAVKKAGFNAIITTSSGSVVTTEPKKSIQEIAKEVIQGKWGNGKARKDALTKAGYDYDKVQKEVDKYY